MFGDGEDKWAGGLELLGCEEIGWMGERCGLLFLVCGLSALCGHCILCRLLWWWPSHSVNMYEGGGGEASGLVRSLWA